MSLETVKAFFSSNNALDRVIELTESSATVDLAAAALGCLPAHIAKTMSFEVNGETILVVCAGDAPWSTTESSRRSSGRKLRW